MCAKLLNLSESDEVIIPSYTFVSAANAFAQTGAKPVFADINLNDLNINIESVEKLITKKTKAICIVHYGGAGASPDRFRDLSKEYNLILINIIANKNLLIEKYFLFKNGKFFKKVICKKWIYTNRLSQEANKEQFIMLLDEIQNHIFIENSNIKYDSKILYYFFDNNQIGIFFEFLGDTLSKFNLSRVTIRNKITMIIDFLEQCITLHNHNIYHSDIKPINICVNLNKIESELNSSEFNKAKAFFDHPHQLA
jgi:hypothetical protein